MTLPYRSYHPRAANRRPSGLRRLFGGGKLLLFLGAIALTGWFGFHQIVNRQLRGRVQERIVEGLRGTGLQVSLGRARFHPDKGLQLNDLKFEHVGLELSPVAEGAQSRIEIYEAFLTARVTMAELATQELEIQAVELRRVKLTLIRDAAGHWDMADVLNVLISLRGEDPKPIPVSLTDCEIRIVDLGNPGNGPITLSNVSLALHDIVYQGRTMLHLQGGFESAAVSKIEFTAFLDRQTKNWQAQLSATHAKISRDLFAIVPEEYRSALDSLQFLSGDINVTAKANGSMTLDEIPSFTVQGDVAHLAVDDARLPFAIREVAGQFGINNQGIVLQGVNGKLGKSGFHFDYSQQGILERESWRCDGDIQEFRFEQSERLAKWLPGQCKKFCHEYSPLGTCNIQFDLDFDQTWLKREITGELTNMSFSYIGLPYEVENCTGKVWLIGEECTFDVRSLMSEQLIRIHGWAKNFRTEPVYEINISVPGDLPFDQKMLAAIDARPAFARIIRPFNATGRVGGVAKIEKRVPGGEVIKAYDVRIEQCSLRHDSFKYPIHNISGMIQARGNSYTFSNLEGNNSNGKVVCNGNWNPVDGLAIRFHCGSIPLNDQLRIALRPEIREIWDGFRPRGTLDFMRIDLTLPIGERDVDLVVEASMNEVKNDAHSNSLSIHPTWFPYEINHITGKVNFGRGQIRLTDVKGWHQRTWVVCSQGVGDYSEDSWSVKLEKLLVASLKVDEDLLAAVPTTLAPAIRSLQYEGLLTVEGELTLAGQMSGTPRGQLVGNGSPRSQAPNGIRQASVAEPLRESSTTMAWDLELDMNQAKMLIGLPLENVFGSVRLVGEFDGESAECRGELKIDSVTVYDAQITEIRGPIWLDNARAAAGIFARPQPNLATMNVSPIEGQKKSHSVTGAMHGGVVNLDAQMNNTGHNAAFYVQATLADSSLETACREFAPQLKDIEGHCFAAFRMSGDFTGTHANRGEGTIKLRDAKIYELPVFLSLLKILNARQVTRTAFDSSNIDFKIVGERIDFTRMEFIGDAISLIGNGKMNLDRDIDLNFYSVMGRNRFYFPIISELYRASSQKILWIKVNGKLDDPQTHLGNGLPQYETLQQLFQPSEQSDVQNRFRQGGQPIPAETRDLRFQSPDPAPTRWSGRARLN